MDLFFLRQTFRKIALALLLGALVFAPWAYGATPAWAVQILDGVLGAALLAWLVGCIPGKSLPCVGLVPFLCVLLLIGYGAFMAWNAHYAYNPATRAFEDVATACWRLPGAMDGAAATAATLHVGLVLGTLLAACDFAREKTARRALLAAMAFTGASVMLLGLLQKATGAPMIFWQPGPARSPFFGTYYYHGNAGSFINLTLPLIFAFALRCLERKAQPALWFPALLVALAAAAVNFSRAAAALSLAGVAAFALHAALHRSAWAVTRAWLVTASLAGALTLVAILLAADPTQAAQKWTWLQEQLNRENPRYAAAQACLDMTRDSAPFGFGPGTFALVFPYYSGPYGAPLRGVWLQAHQDYLQSLIEWGIPGSALFGILYLGALARLCRNHAHVKSDPHLRFGCALALALTGLHALVDFPFQIASLQLYVAVLVGVGWSGAGQGISAPRKVALPNKQADRLRGFSAASG